MGAYFQWDAEKFSVLVDAMDREHQNLIAIMNELHERHGAGASTAELAIIVKRLGDYTAQHFADEEKHMAAIAFPGLKVHARIHADMLGKVAAHYQRFQKGDGYLPPEFFDFLVLWLGAHIQGIDRKYAEHRAPAKI